MASDWTCRSRLCLFHLSQGNSKEYWLLFWISSYHRFRAHFPSCSFLPSACSLWYQSSHHTHKALTSTTPLFLSVRANATCAKVPQVHDLIPSSRDEQIGLDIVEPKRKYAIPMSCSLSWSFSQSQLECFLWLVVYIDRRQLAWGCESVSCIVVVQTVERLFCVKGVQHFPWK